MFKKKNQTALCPVPVLFQLSETLRLRGEGRLRYFMPNSFKILIKVRKEAIHQEWDGTYC